jgi:monoterpene epsilon-lactone hydrolase
MVPPSGISSVGLTTPPPFPEHLKAEGLNLNLGIPDSINPRNSRVFRALASMSSTVFEWTFETPLFFVWKCIPLSIRAGLSKGGWNVFSTLHKYTLGKSTGIHRELSYEAHAFSTLMWCASLMPLTLKRVRFCLSQLEVHHPPSKNVRTERMLNKAGEYVGHYVYSNTKQSGPRNVVFWVYGGAFLGGDVLGNIGMAERFCKAANCDAFLCHYRCCPEYTIGTCQDDVNKAMEWLVNEREVPGHHIKLLGISSGGGLALNAMQHVQQHFPDKQASGAVLIGPWLDYDQENIRPSMLAHAHIDLSVNLSIMEFTLPLTQKYMIGDGVNGFDISPINKSMEGMPKMLVLASTHEVTIDENRELVEKLEKAGRDVEFYTAKYLCHAFPMIAGFMPEGMAAENKIIHWLGQW